jgi:superfamily II DNA or RNA helicase
MVTIDYTINTRLGKIVCENYILEAIRNNFSQEKKGVHFIKKVNKHIPSREYMITPGGQFKIGLAGIIISYIRHELGLNIEFTDKFTAATFGKYGYKPIEYKTFPLRDYQRDIVNCCLNTNNGVVVLGTGGGKTLTMCTLLETIYKNSEDPNTFKCLIIVPDLGLVTQTYNDFKEYGCTFSIQKWTGGAELTMESNVIICNMQILLRRFKKEEWLKFVDLLLVDEVHRVTATELQSVVSKIKTQNRFGFTGTLPIDKIDYWTILGIIGPLIYEKRSKELRDEKYLTNVECKIIRIQYTNGVGKLIADESYNTELEFIQENEFRNKVVRKICTNIRNNILVMVNRIEHGLAIENILRDCGKQVFFIRGSVEVETREAIKKIIEEHNDVVCVAISKIFSTGINIKNLHHIIFCAGGKAFIQIVQSIGRGLRLHPSKSKLTIFDIADDLKHGTNHYEERKKIYDLEQIKFTETNVIEKHQT